MNPQTRRSLLIGALALATGVAGFLLGRLGVDSPKPREARAPLIGIASLDSEDYLRAVREAGGIPVVLPNTGGNTDKIPDYLERLDGLILPGGADIPPSEYGEEPHETVRPLDDDRFRFEKDLVRAWMKDSKKPLLGICLGSQWIAVASGGSLVQDIPSEIGGNHRDTTHPVALEPGSRLAGIFGKTELEVNSLHHQAADTLGPGLKPVAKSPDGVIEATESTDPGRFLIGVQWHPEKMVDDEVQKRLIRAFVEAATP